MRIVAVLAGVSGLVYFATDSPPAGKFPADASAISSPSSINRTAAAGPPAASDSVRSGASTAAIPGPMPGAPTAHTVPNSHVNGPKPLHPSNPDRLKVWVRGPGGTALQQVTTDAGSAMMANSAGQFSDVLRYCTALTASVRDANRAPAIPDFAMQKRYMAALDEFRLGAMGCVAAISQHPEGAEDTATDVNKSVLARALARFGTGQSDLYVATEMLRKQ